MARYGRAGHLIRPSPTSRTAIGFWIRSLFCISCFP